MDNCRCMSKLGASILLVTLVIDENDHYRVPIGAAATAASFSYIHGRGPGANLNRENKRETSAACEPGYQLLF